MSYIHINIFFQDSELHTLDTMMTNNYEIRTHTYTYPHTHRATSKVVRSQRIQGWLVEEEEQRNQ